MRAARIQAQKEFVVEHPALPDQREMWIFWPEGEQIAPETGIEVGNPYETQISRQRIRQAGSEVDAPALLDQPRRIDNQGHMIPRESERLPRGLVGGRVAMIAVHHEHGVLKVRRPPCLREERLERIVQEPQTVVGRQTVEAVILKRVAVQLRQLESVLVLRDRVRPMVSRGLNEGEERFFLVAKRVVRFFEQDDVRHAPGVLLRRAVIALFVNVQTGNIVREQTADIAPGSAAAEEIKLVVSG